MHQQTESLKIEHQISVQVRTKYYDRHVSPKLKLAVQRTFELYETNIPYLVSIIISDDEHLMSLNNTYRGVNSTTDVLSFTSNEYDPDTGKTYLGDVVISFPTAFKQSIDIGHPVSTELQILTIHGTLHLLGFDHANLAEKQVMWDLQNKILLSLGVKPERFSGDK